MNKSIPELKNLTPEEIAGSPELFQRNEYYRLTGEWFIPLPFHFWDLKKGMGLEIQYHYEDGSNENLNLAYFDSIFDYTFSAFINPVEPKSEWLQFDFRNIKRMRIKSFEVKNDTP